MISRPPRRIRGRAQGAVRLRVYDNKTVIIEAISVEAIDDRGHAHRTGTPHLIDGDAPTRGQTRPVYSGGKWHDARIVRRDG
jgi:5-oxoprolinase (ATP-hydrolysing)